MRPLELYIKNYRAFEEVALPLEAITAAAVTGPNGAGKSTLCEAIVWALYGEGRSSNVDGVVRLGAEEAVVRLVYEHDGNRYKIVRKRSRGRRSDLQYMVAQDGRDTWKPLTGANMRETQQRIVRDLAMDEDLYFASSCVMQGRSAGICEAGPAERKAVLYKILEDRLGIFGPLHDAAKRRIKEIEQTLAARQSKRGELESVIQARATEESSKADACQELRVMRCTEGALAKEIKEAEESLARRDNLVKQVEDYARRKEETNAEIKRLGFEIEHYEKTIADSKVLLEKADVLREQAAECERREALLVEMEQLAKRHREIWDRYNRVYAELDKEAAVLGRQEEDIAREIEIETNRIAQLQEQYNLALEVPCAGTPYNNKCQLLTAAMDAKDRIVECQRNLADLNVKAEQVAALIRNHSARYTELDKIEAEALALGYDEKAHDQLRDSLIPLREARSRLPEISAAQARKDAAFEALTSAHKNLHQLQEKLKTLEQEMKALAEQLEAEGGAPTQDVVASMKDKHASTLAAIERLLQEIAIHEDRLARIADAEAELANLTAEMESLERDRTIYAELTKAFSRDGIPALIIDAALPQIEDHANEVLARLSDGRMTVRFETQRGLVSGGVAETLDIIIADPAGERPYEDWSGGERLRIDLAVRVALGRALAQRTGSRIELLMLDEVCAPLDEAGEEALIDSINRLQDSFRCILLITHRDRLRDRLPQQITVTKNEYSCVAVSG